MKEGPETPTRGSESLEIFRHEQTVKRWKRGNTRKASKIVYVSDFLSEDLRKLRLSPSGSTNAPTECAIPSGTLLLGNHCRGRHSARIGYRSVPAPRQRRSARCNLTVSKSPSGKHFYGKRKKPTALKRRVREQREAAWLSCSVPPSIKSTVSASVAELGLLTTQLDLAVQQRQYRLVRRLRRVLRNRQYKLCKLLSREEQITSAATAPCGEKTGSLPAVNDGYTTAPVLPCQPPALCSSSAQQKPSLARGDCYPTTVALDVGRHPHSSVIDRRSGRYPQKIDLATVREFLRNASSLSMDLSACMDDCTRERLRQFCVSYDGTTAAIGEGETGSHKPRIPPRKKLPRLFVRDYCRNVLTDFLDDITFTTLQALYSEQRELKERQPLQFKARQRYVVGFNETIKHLRAGRVRLVVLAADVEAGATKETSLVEPPSTSATQNGKKKFQLPDDAVREMLCLCAGDPREGVKPPALVTCMSRQRLSYALYAKNSAVSCVGILRAEKNLDLLKSLCHLGEGLSLAYSLEACESGAG